MHVICPGCNNDIANNHIDRDLEVGINASGWYCEACDEFVFEGEE